MWRNSTPTANLALTPDENFTLQQDCRYGPGWTSMDLSDSPEELQFRLTARQWLEQNKPAGMADRGFALPIDEQSIRTLREWQRRLYDAGYLGISWPAEYGGRGKTIIESAIFNEEMARARAPAPLNELGLSMG